MLFNILLIFITSLICFSLYTFYRFIISPYLDMQYYKKQGAPTRFHWGILPYPSFTNDLETTGHYYGYYKQLLAKKPEIRMVAENFADRSCVIFFDVNLIKLILQKHEIYQKDEYFSVVLKKLVNGGTFLTEKADWKRARRMIAPAFTFDFIKDTIPVIVKITQEHFEDLIKKDNLKDIEIVQTLGEISGEVTGTFFFGDEFKGYKLDGVPLAVALSTLMVAVVSESFSNIYMLFGPKLLALNILPRHRKLNKDIQAFTDYCLSIVQEIEKNPKKDNSLLTYILNQRKQNDDGLTNDEIVAEFIGLFIAGTDFIAQTINATIYYLCKNPNILNKLKEDINREISDSNSMNIENLNRMDYLEAILKETLRLAGPVDMLNPRSAVQDDVIDGIKIKKGTIISVCFATMHCLEEYFHDPETFNPERWLTKDSGAQDKGRSETYAYLPFSGGPRVCLGKNFGLLMSKIIIILLMKRFEFSIPADYKMTMALKTMYEPLEPIKVTLVPKEEKRL